mmetsp:Transcript_28511/g.32963  ORF Transcript_28511/g.32963 Transcript_28511/m.32963 type:complete len:240 (+) Transcript_28511:51-770(+)|eukprot:CAMPEP_0176441862 /NCGR_PEP_ID=MMETSP0127-20121128/21464_1 /TAXON_ID=938130 /ORGANISM="Platyophrya macrostoma, Strain WH" /LENGTH=239 /DNA_ID=CAMNT_0017826749 /DNA_START=51 /DNA_END=770 /DNA_ORIENTATION=-
MIDYEKERERIHREKGAYFAEFIGCFFINFTMHSMNRNTSSAYTPFVIGSSFFLAVFLSYRISGAHLNAAVTLATWFKNRETEDYTKYLYYVLFQILGGLCAGFLIAFMGFELILPDHDHEATISEAVAMEAFFTFFLCLIYLHINDPARPKTDAVVAGIVIGSTVLLISMTLGPATGGIINPSVGFSVGICRMIFVANESTNMLYVWILSPFVGALFSNWFYEKYLRSHLKPAEITEH